MSGEERLRVPLAEAEEHAARLVALLSPACTRIEVAGSIRRRKALVKDIELVAIGRQVPSSRNLWGEVVAERNALDLLRDELLASGELMKRLGKGGHTSWGYGATYAWYMPDGVDVPVALDVFGTTAEQFGLTLMIRTGPAEWNQRWVTRRTEGGAVLPAGMRVEGGWLWDGDRRLTTREESDVFNAINLPWVAPEDRT